MLSSIARYCTQNYQNQTRNCINSPLIPQPPPAHKASLRKVTGAFLVRDCLLGFHGASTTRSFCSHSFSIYPTANSPLARTLKRLPGPLPLTIFSCRWQVDLASNKSGGGVADPGAFIPSHGKSSAIYHLFQPVTSSVTKRHKPWSFFHEISRQIEFGIMKIGPVISNMWEWGGVGWGKDGGLGKIAPLQSVML